MLEPWWLVLSLRSLPLLGVRSRCDRSVVYRGVAREDLRNVYILNASLPLLDVIK